MAGGIEAIQYNNLFRIKAGEPVYQFLMLEQLYDSHGKPIEGAYNRAPNDSYSKIAEHTAEPDLLFGLSSDFSYNRFSLSAMLRGSTGNYVYSIADARKSYLGYISPGDGYLQNLSGSYLYDGFENNQFRSSYYIKNASFLRLEFLQLGYDFGLLWKDKASLKVTGTVQNALVITKYKGQDPEVVDGIDDGQYPIPTTFSVGLNLNI